jgi:GntR family transcriptional regulator/MocR family aminotransferase
MRIPLNRDGQEPLYRQIQDFLQHEIRSGALEPETKLPASRHLASQLGVSRVTITNAYAELEADGLVYTRPGSGTYVAYPLASPPKPTSTTDVWEWPLWQQALLSTAWQPERREFERSLEKSSRPDLISFAPGYGAEDLFPADEFRKTLNDVLRRQGPSAFAYGNRAGYPPLRETVAHILSAQGIPTSTDEVLITSGSQQALALVAQVLLRPGDVVLMESPSYIGAIDLFHSLDVRLLGMPMDEEGLLVEEVEKALNQYNPRLIYTIPTFHNPTGICLGGMRRRQLIDLANQFDVPLLEDDCFGDLRYEGRALPALKALDRKSNVIYVNTFSKMLMPGLRVGYLVASGPIYDQLLACKYATDLATCSPMQLALEAYISVGRYQANLRKICRVYHRRRDSMLEALARLMPEGVHWQTPQGGLCLWIQLPQSWDATDLHHFALEQGVVYAPGAMYFPVERQRAFLRLNFAVHPPQLAEEGLRRLRSAMDQYIQHLDQRRKTERPERHVTV